MDERNLEEVEKALRAHWANVRESCKGADSYAIEEVTLTYGALAQLSGVGIARGMRPYLDAIAERCRGRREPLLDCLVINKKLRMPGNRLARSRDVWEKEVRRCIDFV